MHVSKGFLSLLEHQLAQFEDRAELRSLVVYLAGPAGDSKPQLMAVGQWPSPQASLPPLDQDPELRLPDPGRRWLPLRRGPVLLGALRVESDPSRSWPEALQRRLQSTAQVLSEALALDLERQGLERQLQDQSERLGLLVHQLRNPLAALRTFAQLLLRRLDGDAEQRALVLNLLGEQERINQYLEAIHTLTAPARLSGLPDTPPALLLPPALGEERDGLLAEALEPLLERAAATAALQGRPWHAPAKLPVWRGETAPVAEIIANLLENAFRYSRAGSPVGLHWDQGSGDLRLCIWDGGEPVDADERERIFQRGERGRQGQGLAGSGLGLALARDLAGGLGGQLTLVSPPARLAADLPEQGNAFCLSLPRLAEPGEGPQQADKGGG